MLICFFNMSVKMGDGNIIPAIDIHFFNVRIRQIPGQYRILRHLGIEPFNKGLSIVTHDKIFGIIKILTDICFQLRRFFPVNQCGGVIFCNIPLCKIDKKRQFNLRHTVYRTLSAIIFMTCINFLSRRGSMTVPSVT